MVCDSDLKAHCLQCLIQVILAAGKKNIRGPPEYEVETLIEVFISAERTESLEA